MTSKNQSIDPNDVEMEKAILRLLLSVCRLRGDLTTALAMEGVTDEIRRRFASTGEGTISAP
ncbi:hypothetical protein ACKFKG_26770 [Phormidesmis sp. 146-35]